MRNAYGKKNPQTTKYGAFVRTNPTFFNNSKIESTMRVRFLIMAFLLTAMLPLAGAAGSDWKTAPLMNSGDTKNGQLSNTHTEDWYKIVVPEKQNGTAKFIITCSDGFEIGGITLCGLKGGEIQQRNYVGKEGQLTVSDIASGTYYVKVSHGFSSGSYNLDYTFTPNATPNDAEPNDTYDTGELLESGKTATGHLGYLYCGYDTRDTEDWYKIVVPKSRTERQSSSSLARMVSRSAALRSAD